MELDVHLSALSRRVGHLRVLRRCRRFLRRYYSRVYKESDRRDAIIEDFDGSLRMKLDRSKTIGSRIQWEGYASRGEIRVLKERLRPDSVFIDVGANQGEFTLVAAKKLARGTVLAFEPLPGNFERLEENLRLNEFQNVRLFPFGLGQVEEEREIFQPARSLRRTLENEGAATLQPGAEGSVSLGTVQIRRLDDVLASTAPGRLDMIKIDVEGSELNVLRGARETIATFRPELIVELSDVNLGPAGYTGDDVLAFLTGLGYRPYRIRRSHIEPYDGGAISRFLNVLCVPEGVDPISDRRIGPARAPRRRAPPGGAARTGTAT